jgi:two-component system, OmpR family, sensor histidine kinase ArlS
MNLKIKITLLLTLWLLFILLLCNVVIYYLFIRITTNSELELLKDQAQTLLLKDISRHPEYWDIPGELDRYLIPREMIRYVTANANVLFQVYRDKELLTKPPQYVLKETTRIVNRNGAFYVYVMTPVYENEHQVATLEIGRSLGPLSNFTHTLLSILLLVSVGAVILSLLGGYFYTKVLLKPLDQLIFTMQTIEENGVFRRIDLESHPERDELTMLGATFNRMIDRLEETFQRHEQFLADASHELRTPITVIDSYASLLRRWASSDPALREEALDAIQSESAQLKQLTQNLLSLMNTEEKQRIKWVEFDLEPLVQSTAASLRLTFNRSIEVRLSHEGCKSLTMRGDPEKIKQLLVILLDNALKYSKKAVILSIEKEARHMKMQVIDEGIGIAEEDLPHLFDRFYRADKARNRKLGGAGLGLAISENIVRQHGGTITMSSRLGEGTTVTVKLPITCQ